MGQIRLGAAAGVAADHDVGLAIVRTAHVLVGACVLAASVVAALQAYRAAARGTAQEHLSRRMKPLPRVADDRFAPREGDA